MKTKLLKKVRKRYEIVKVTELSSSHEMWNTFNMDSERKFGLPFFILRDLNDSWRDRSAKDIDVLLETLQEWIRFDYAKTKKSKHIEEKVWHV